MRIYPEDYVREFYETLPEEFKQFSYENIKAACTAPFLFLRKCISSNSLPTVRFKYLGVFRIYPKKAKAELEKAEIRFAKGYISEAEYFRIKNMVENFLERQGISTEEDEENEDN